VDGRRRHRGGRRSATTSAVRRSRGRTAGISQRPTQPGDFGFESLDPFGLLGDEHVGGEQLADELDEELAGVGVVIGRSFLAKVWGARPPRVLQAS